MAETLLVNEIYLSLQGESTFAGLPCIFVRLTGCPLRCSYCDTAYAFQEGQRRSLDNIRAEVHRLAAPFPRNSPCPEAAASSPDAWTPTPGAVPGQTPPWERPAFQPGVSPAAGGSSPAEIRAPAEASLPLGADAGGSRARRLPLVELTGGEPLRQRAVLPLMRALCDDGFTVLLETSGALEIAPVDPRVHRIMDLKCPSSGEEGRNLWENLEHLRPHDELKFVIGTVEDYDWACAVLARHRLERRCPLLFSWAAPLGLHQRDPTLKAPPPGHTPLGRSELAERVLADALPVRFQVQLHKVLWPPDRRGV